MNYEKKAKELRQEILKSLFACQSGHPGGSLSCVEILMALYYDEMKNLDPKDPKKADRDRLVLRTCLPYIICNPGRSGIFPERGSGTPSSD